MIYKQFKYIVFQKTEYFVNKWTYKIGKCVQSFKYEILLLILYL